MKNNRIIVLLSVACILISATTFGQQQAQYSQYMYNTLMVNPAYAGTRGRLETYFIHRSQWVGLKGAPRTENFGISGDVGKGIGVGLNVINDQLGPSNLTTITAAASAKIPLTDQLKLSIGIDVGLDLLSVHWSEGQMQNSSDELMYGDIKNRARPIVGAGVYLYSDHWYFGIAAPTFIHKGKYGKEEGANINSRLHLYALAGYVFNVGTNTKLKPSMLMKGVKGAPVSFDVSLNAQFKDKYTVGLGYRIHDAVYLMLGYTFIKSFYIGYSYDLNVSKLRGFNSGSHDIILKYTLWNKENGAVSPRFF